VCKRCDRAIDAVSAENGWPRELVAAVHAALKENLVRQREEEPTEEERADFMESVQEAGQEAAERLSRIMGRPLQPYLLGMEPFVLITMTQLDEADAQGYATAGVSLRMGGIAEHELPTILGSLLAAHEARETGGVMEDGTLLEPRPRD
jgi:hypothetical protein